MKIDLSTERKEQACVFYQNEHNLVSKIWVSYVYVKFPQLFILFSFLLHLYLKEKIIL